MEQRFSFDKVAGAYDLARPGYPEALVDDVIAFAGLKEKDRILEVGCGTGQATKSFASRGFPILAIEPGPEMLGRAQENLAAFRNVAFSQATFEAWPVRRGGFGLIVAAQSWHWVAPDARFVKAAEALSLNGSLAVFGHVPVGLPPALTARFRQIYLRRTGMWGPPPEAWYLPGGPIKQGFDQSALFGPVEHKGYPWKWRHTTASYTDFLLTKSDFQMMEPAKRQKMLGEIAEAIDSEGGKLTVDHETHLYIARVLPGPSRRLRGARSAL